MGILKLFLDECTAFTILGFMTIVLQGLLSLHHLEKLGKIPLTTLITGITKNNHNNPTGNHAYV
jgi:hypothetical protein